MSIPQLSLSTYSQTSNFYSSQFSARPSNSTEEEYSSKSLSSERFYSAEEVPSKDESVYSAEDMSPKGETVYSAEEVLSKDDNIDSAAEWSPIYSYSYSYDSSYDSSDDLASDDDDFLMTITVNEMLKKDSENIYEDLKRKGGDGSFALHDVDFFRTALPLLHKMIDNDMVDKVFDLLFCQTDLEQKTSLHDIEFDEGLIALLNRLYQLDKSSLVKLLSMLDATQQTCILSEYNFEKYFKIVLQNSRGKFFDSAPENLTLVMFRNRLKGRDPTEKVFVEENGTLKFPKRKKFKDMVSRWMESFDLNRCVSAFLQRDHDGSTVLHDPVKFNYVWKHLIKIGKVDIDVFFDIIGTVNDRGRTPLHLPRFSNKFIGYFDLIADTKPSKLLRIFKKQDMDGRTCLINAVNGVSSFEQVAPVLTKIAERSLMVGSLVAQELIEVLEATFTHLNARNAIILLHALPILQNLMKSKNLELRHRADALFSKALMDIFKNDDSISDEVNEPKSHSFEQHIRAILEHENVEANLKESLMQAVQTHPSFAFLNKEADNEVKV